MLLQIGLGLAAIAIPIFFITAVLVPFIDRAICSVIHYIEKGCICLISKNPFN
jgi:hypothetical protein